MNIFYIARCRFFISSPYVPVHAKLFFFYFIDIDGVLSEAYVSARFCSERVDGVQSMSSSASFAATQRLCR